MAKFFTSAWIVFTLLLVSVGVNQLAVNAQTERKAYIVYMGAKLKEEHSVEQPAQHLQLLFQKSVLVLGLVFLSSTLISFVTLEAIVSSGSLSSAKLVLEVHQFILFFVAPVESLIYTYKKSFNGFAAWLTEQESKKLLGAQGVISVFPSRTLKTHTTRSWDFLGLPSTVKRIPEVESNVIIRLIDTGIWPESESFNDNGIGIPPKKWKGICQNITCNKIAVYKVCWKKICLEHDILAAFDDAIADGIDILSVSIGREDIDLADYSESAIAVGAFHAMQHGIFTSASAGNRGFLAVTVQSGAPWILTVAASTTDRKFITNITLGNNKTLTGPAINVFPTSEKFYPLVQDEYCEPDEMDQNLTKGNIVLCNPINLGNDGSGPLVYGAYGTIMIATVGEWDVPYPYPLPASAVTNSDGEYIASYISSTRNATAIIHDSEVVYDPSAPSLASITNRGPSILTPAVLKPDISAPGVDILAAWSPKGLVSRSGHDQRSVMYNIVSGTSQACPHAAGAAAYVKTFHPTWSPAAIKSALMTTASPMKTIDEGESEFGYGVGQIDPVKAVNPGLLYDALEVDYAEMLCDLNYTADKIRIITGENITCSASKGGEALLNYPSMAVYYEPDSFRLRKYVVIILDWKKQMLEPSSILYP
ncbi:hypothetical protein IFM89_032749 [Coptis chinensis]|uniref:Uncharacterized protein n=1 Tax=Coptis chinensis TaxID=261450 RepID=A0A835HE97_9MAGN|nr:hypothetical protein IFM89_032749 [Coptis chinensis]